jgi:acid stress chaperone HdeB
MRSPQCRWSLKLTFAALLIFGFIPTSNAVVIDLSLLTCQEFLAADKDEIRIILAWLDGYYKDEQDPAILDTDVLIANLKKLNEYCRESNRRPHDRNQQSIWEVRRGDRIDRTRFSACAGWRCVARRERHAA